MKDDKLYAEYLNYLNWRLNESQISKGEFSLSKISESKFNQFKKRFEEDELFSELVVKIHTTINRDKKLDDIFDDID
jgi:hypothetical protein